MVRTLPGFTAELATHRSSGIYRSAKSEGSLGTIVVAQMSSACRGACGCCRWKGLEGCCDICFDCLEV
jgi:hypothetical protein